jgi:tetratricopeptide (TPR) repeat protein
MTIVHPDQDGFHDSRNVALQWLIEPLGDNPFLPALSERAPPAVPLYAILAAAAPAARPQPEENLRGWLRYTHFLATRSSALIDNITVVPAPAPGSEGREAEVTITVADARLLDHLPVGTENDYSAPFEVEAEVPRWQESLIELWDDAWLERDHEPLRLTIECLLAFEPEHADALYFLGELERLLQRPAAAADAYARAIAARPDDWTACARRAECLRQLGDRQGALALYDQALRGDPSLGVWGERGALRLELGDLAGARADLRRQLELEPDDQRARALLARLEPGLAT